MPLNAIGLVEVSSIAKGYEAVDAMLKTASVQLLVARTICSGKYIIVVGGDVAAVASSVESGAAQAEGFLIEQRVIPRIHPGIFPAIAGSVDLDAGQAKALGIVETFSAASIIECADAAAKAADVIIFRVHLAMAVGGKGFFSCTGDVAAVQAAVEAAAQVAARDGILAGKSVIPAPRLELFQEYI
ncbi:MAG TPA: BMC domain-containing protein [Candidatus Sumerlaeota bacterium]|nr:BMC domain-containing protein [Candidatus Sumerlaeota bacterium]HRR31014.1 BMC domain-containing protein [Candidatus Sumerlaeia bacterium]HON50173.1 BMC domain-containing protein [Candidatus Sumerlaeota bacterium]HOR63389.1 BMC domain-containing protein [Candidatus Sumerlaeota bacterium]HPL74140.1 BMC domain-containing protein [Candidatus Sumerlaeota bacterium]